MKRKIKFVKMHSLGNDFVVIDRILQSFPLQKELLAKVGHRTLGIGCDQILIVEPPSQPDYDFNYRIFNANGTEVEQCGNGARCFGRYVYEKGLTEKSKIRVGCWHNAIEIDLSDPNHIEANLGTPRFAPNVSEFNVNHLKKQGTGRYKLTILNDIREATLLSIGNPHCVLAVSNTQKAPVEKIGTALQEDISFPNGVNVSFVEVLARNHIKMRVYERGVGETSACGTAACAAVIAGILQNELSRNVQVDMPGGSVSVVWHEDKTVSLSGNTQIVFDGGFVIRQTNESEFAF